MFRVVAGALGVITSVTLGYLSLRGIDYRLVWKILRDGQYLWMIPSTILVACAVFVRGVRWRVLFQPTTRPGLAPAMTALLIGYFFNQILPARAGEAARVQALHRESGASRAEATATAIVERVYDVISLILILILMSPVLPYVEWLRGALIVGAVMLVGAAAAALVVARYGERVLRSAVARIARATGKHSMVERMAGNFLAGLRASVAPRRAPFVLALTLLSWTLVAVSYSCAIRATGVDVSATASLLIVVATNLALVLPSLPAAVGVFEAAVLVSLSSYGVSGAQAISVAITLHALNIFPFILAGPIALYFHGRLRRRHQAHAVVTEPRESSW